MVTILSFLFDHLHKLHTPTEWCSLLNVKIIDADGWRGRYDVFTKPISLTEFLEKISRSTIKVDKH